MSVARLRRALPTPEALEARARAELDRAWASPTGAWGWLTGVDHKVIAGRYLVTALVILAPAIGAMLVPAHIRAVDAMTLLFLLAVPLVLGLGLYLVPLMLGTRDVAFPRLNAFGSHVYVGGGIALWAAFLLNLGLEAGWVHLPLAPEGWSGTRIDVWAAMVVVLRLAALVAAFVIIVTTLTHRAPGMSLDRLPVLAWAMLVMATTVVLIVPVLVVADGVAAVGGTAPWHALLGTLGYQDFVLILVPVMGLASTLVVAFARRPLVGYAPVVASLVAIGAVSVALWVHQVLPIEVLPARSVVLIAAAILASAIVVHVVCWIATVLRGHVRPRTPLMCALGVAATLVVGLASLVLVPVPAIRFAEPFAGVAQVRYIAGGTTLFALLGAIHYWLPKMTGRLLGEAAGQACVWTLFAGVNLGLLGALAGEALAPAAPIGAALVAVGVLLLVANVAVSLRHGSVAGPNPWGADTLEWATSSPPPSYNFLHPPTVCARYPLWTWPEQQPVVAGLRNDTREVLVTSRVAAWPRHRQVLAGPSVAPFLAAMGVTLGVVATIFTFWGALFGAALALPALVDWLARPGASSRNRRPANGILQRLARQQAADSPSSALPLQQSSARIVVHSRRAWTNRIQGGTRVNTNITLGIDPRGGQR